MGPRRRTLEQRPAEQRPRHLPEIDIVTGRPASPLATARRLVDNALAGVAASQRARVLAGFEQWSSRQSATNIRVFSCCLRQFREHVAQSGFDRPILETDARMICSFKRWLVVERGLSPATGSSYAASVALLWRWAHRPRPTRDARVREQQATFVTAYAETRGGGPVAIRMNDGPLPLIALLAPPPALPAGLSRQPTYMRWLRARAIVRLCYAGALTNVQVTKLMLADIERDEAGYVLLVPGRYGVRRRPLLPGDVAAVQAWTLAAGLPVPPTGAAGAHALLFRGVGRGGKIFDSFGPKEVAEDIRRLVRAAASFYRLTETQRRTPLGRVTVKSFTIGRFQDLHLRGASVLSIAALFERDHDTVEEALGHFRDAVPSSA